MNKKSTLITVKKSCFIAFFTLFVLGTEGGGLRAQNNIKTEEEDLPTIEAMEEVPQTELVVKEQKIYKTDNYPNENMEVRPFDAKTVAKAKAGLDYRKPTKVMEEEEERQRQAEERRKKQTQDTAGTTEVKKLPPPDFSALGKVLTWVFIAIAVGLIVWLVMRAIKEGNIFSPANKKIKLDGETIDIEHIEENLVQIDDLDPVIQQAIRQGNYTLAIRLYYLAILKALTEDQAIVWKRDKTNRAYVAEMRNHTFSQSFSSTTRLFERVWYGNLNLQVVDFERIKPDFDQLLRGIKNLNTKTPTAS